MDIQTIAHGFGPPATARGKVTHAIETSFITAIRELSTAVIMEADIARIAAIGIILNKIDAFAIRRSAGTAGAGRCARGILAARCEEKEADCGEEG